jgi:hypothetical protein
VRQRILAVCSVESYKGGLTALAREAP